MSSHISVDVLIIGGGAQGLWLLRNLNAESSSNQGYRTLLLEKNTLGGGQTCHSHGFIHRGHYYSHKSDIIITLNAAAQFWEAFVQDRGIKKLNYEKAIVGLSHKGQINRQRSNWDTNGLKYKEIKSSNDFPKILQGGSIREVYQTEEFSLNTKEIICALKDDLDHLIFKFDEGTDLQFHLQEGMVNSVDCFLYGEKKSIKVKEIILAAGEGNLEILKKIGVEPSVSDPIQARRKSQMIVVKGNIPELTAIFPDLTTPQGGKGLFICTRLIRGANKALLVSDDISTNFETDDKSDPSVDKNRLQRTVRSLHSIAPNLFKRKLEWSIYTGLTSERDIGKAEHMDDFFIESFGLKNVMTIWPTKLTLTPFVSKAVSKMIALKIPNPAGKIPVMDIGFPNQKPNVSDETWARESFNLPTAVKTPFMNGKDFSNEYGPFHSDLGNISFK